MDELNIAYQGRRNNLVWTDDWCAVTDRESGEVLWRGLPTPDAWEAAWEHYRETEGRHAILSPVTLTSIRFLATLRRAWDWKGHPAYATAMVGGILLAISTVMSWVTIVPGGGQTLYSIGPWSLGAGFFVLAMVTPVAARFHASLRLLRILLAVVVGLLAVVWGPWIASVMGKAGGSLHLSTVSYTGPVTALLGIFFLTGAFWMTFRTASALVLPHPPVRTLPAWLSNQETVAV